MAEIIKSQFISSFRGLEVYRQAYRLCLDIHKKSLEFPKIEQYALADQIRRSSRSVCANIVEGYGRQKQSKPEFKRFIMMAIGSCEETRMWLDLCRDLGYIDASYWEEWEKSYETLLRMLHKFRSSIS